MPSELRHMGAVRIRFAATTTVFLFAARGVMACGDDITAGNDGSVLVEDGSGGTDASFDRDGGMVLDAGVIEAGGNDAGADAGPRDAGPSAMRVFVTSTQYSGDLKGGAAGTTGPEGADRYCEARARAAGLTGLWRAFVSSSSQNAVDRVGAGPWSTVGTSKLVFANKADIASGPKVPIDRDENGAQVGPSFVWTGSTAGGIKADRCLDWTSQSPGAALGVVGLTSKTTSEWTNAQPDNCSALHRLYCFSF